MASKRKEAAAAKRLLLLADQANPRVRAQVESALAELQRSISLERLERVLASGDYFSMYDLTSSLPARLAAVVTTLRRLTSRAAIEEASSLKSMGVSMRLTLMDPWMIEAARTGSAKLIRQITEETRRAVRQS